MRFTKRFIAAIWEAPGAVYQHDDRTEARDLFTQRFKDPMNAKFQGKLYERRGNWWYWVEWWGVIPTSPGLAIQLWRATGSDFSNLQPLDLSSTRTLKKWTFRSIGIRVIEIAVMADNYGDALSQAKAITKGKFILQLDKVE